MQLRWPLIFGLWTVPPLVVSASILLRQGGAGLPVPMWRLVLGQMLTWYPWALLTPLVFLLHRRLPVSAGRRLRDLAGHALASAAIGLGFGAYLIAQEWIAGTPIANVDRGVLLGTLIAVGTLNATIYWIVLGVARGLQFAQRRKERQAQLVRARLQALTAQVHPHFLFNTLNTISSLIDEDTVAARQMVARLGELLRASLSVDDADEIPLGDEVELTRLYLDIERVRFEDRMQVDYRIAPDVTCAAVPRLVLQPLVENAVRHGIARTRDAGHIEIDARRRNGALEIRVSDDGPGPSVGAAGHGIGLRNTRARLEELHGVHASLRLTAREPRGCRVTLTLPYREIEP